MSRELPVWPIVKRALLLPVEHLGFALRIGWPIILLMVLPPVAVALGLMEAPKVTGAQKVQLGWNLESFTTGVGAIPLILLQGFLLAVIAVYWHRHVLLQETEAPAVPLRFDAIQLRYIGYALLVFVISTGVWLLGSLTIALLFALLSQLGGSAVGQGLVVVAFLAMVPLVMLFFVAFFRLSLVLPAAAIGHQGFGLREAWQASRGNSWAILGIQLLVFLILLGIAIPILLALFLLGGVELYMLGIITGWPGVLLAAGNAVFYLLFTLMGIGLLSLTYAYLIYDPPQEDARMEA